MAGARGHSRNNFGGDAGKPGRIARALAVTTSMYHRGTPHASRQPRPRYETWPVHEKRTVS